MKKIAIVTATRAEYGLLAPVIRELRTYESEDFRVELIVTGTHLSEDYGFTINEIVQDSIRIDKKISIMVASNTVEDIAKNQAVALNEFTHLFSSEKYDAVLLLGDRYETLMIAIAAGNVHIPIFHMCGGDTTEGAMDEWIRHSITKMSYLHYVTNEDSKRRVIQLGEDPNRVYNFGSTSIDNIYQMNLMTKKESLSSIKMDDCDYILGTYHPVTLENSSLKEQVHDFLQAIREFPDIQFIITKANADLGGQLINDMLEDSSSKLVNLHVYSSLGRLRYLSLMKHARCVIGNSSSGIIETPALHIPTINIGNRQKGRLQGASIINCDSTTQSIVDAITKVLTDVRFLRVCNNAESLYGDGHAAEKIAKKSFECINENRIDLKKSFYILNK